MVLSETLIQLMATLTQSEDHGIMFKEIPINCSETPMELSVVKIPLKVTRIQ
jgi:hypothetical protein